MRNENYIRENLKLKDSDYLYSSFGKYGGDMILVNPPLNDREKPIFNNIKVHQGFVEYCDNGTLFLLENGTRVFNFNFNGHDKIHRFNWNDGMNHETDIMEYLDLLYPERNIGQCRQYIKTATSKNYGNGTIWFVLY